MKTMKKKGGGTMENNVKKLTPNDLQGLSGGYDLEDLSPEELMEWNNLVKTWCDARGEEQDLAWQAMMHFNDRMKAKYD